MSWIDFRNQALQDMSSVPILREHKDYGNSAYLLQQCIEKFVKSIVIRYELSTKSMGKLGHMPLDELWDDLYQRMDEFIERSTSETAKTNYENMSETIGIIKEFFQRSQTDLKKALWKDSMKIPLSREEEDKLLDFIHRLKEELKPQIRKLSIDLFDLFKRKIKPFFKNLPISQKRKIQNLLDVIQLDVDLDRLDEISISTHHDIDELVMEMPVFFLRIEKLYQIIRKDPHKMHHLDSEEALNILFSWLFSYSTQILKVYAHESIGRYPTEIDERSSRNLYKEKFVELKDLENEVIEACRRLNSMIFYKTPHD